MATTIISSMSVKPCMFFFMGKSPFLGFGLIGMGHKPRVPYKVWTVGAVVKRATCLGLVAESVPTVGSIVHAMEMAAFIPP